MAQQTSVEWLIKKIGEYIDIASIPHELIDQAKEMHKADCENSWMDGFNFNSNYKDFEDYYNQTYNK